MLLQIMHTGAFAVFFVTVAFELFADILFSIFAGLSFTPEYYIKYTFLLPPPQYSTFSLILSVRSRFAPTAYNAQT